MLDTNLKQQLKTYLQNLTSAVELSVFLGEDLKSKELATLVTEIAEMSALVTVVAADSVELPVSPFAASSEATLAGSSLIA